MAITYKNRGRKLPIQDAQTSLWFEIDPKAIRGKACRLDGHQCAVAQALWLSYPDLIDVEIGAKTSFVVLKNKIMRYLTPRGLRDGLVRFDETGDWNLPKGLYQLKAPTTSMSVEAERQRGRRRRDRGRAKHYNASGDRYPENANLCKKSSLNPRYIAAISEAE